MTVLLARTRGPSRPWRTSDPSSGPTIPVKISDAPFERSRAHQDNPAEAMRACRLLGTELRYIAHPSFDDPETRDAILAPMPVPDVLKASRRTKAPAGLPPYLASLYDETPLLTREQEAHLFRKMNYLKCLASRLHARIDPARACTTDLDQIEWLLDEALAIRNQIVRANLRLVVAIARRYLGPCDNLFERVSDGNYVMIRAVERFDYARGNKFSTYASWAMRNQFARDFRGKNPRSPQFLRSNFEALEVVVDPRTDDLDRSELQERRQEAVARLLDRLNVRERRIIAGRYGIGGAHALTLTQLGEEMGITKERVRQIEVRAREKLRRLARTEASDLLTA